MRSYTANTLIRHVLNSEGHIGHAIHAMHADIGNGHSLRLETALDAARGLFTLRDDIPHAGEWALRLLHHATRPEHGFHPVWRAVALKVSFYEQLGDIANAKKHYKMLVKLSENSHEAGVVAERLYQKLCQQERFWSL